jgi:hypothetical protein
MQDELLVAGLRLWVARGERRTVSMGNALYVIDSLMLWRPKGSWSPFSFMHLIPFALQFLVSWNAQFQMDDLSCFFLQLQNSRFKDLHLISFLSVV